MVWGLVTLPNMLCESPAEKFLHAVSLPSKTLASMNEFVGCVQSQRKLRAIFMPAESKLLLFDVIHLVCG